MILKFQKNDWIKLAALYLRLTNNNFIFQSYTICHPMLTVELKYMKLSAQITLQIYISHLIDNFLAKNMTNVFLSMSKIQE